MSRALDTNMQAALSAGVITPCIMAAITFKSGTQYAWTGIGNLVYDAQTYIGVGSLMHLGSIMEGTEVRADGTSIGLSGIDATLHGDCLTEIQQGAPANIYLALLTQGVVIGSPYLLFSGVVDAPSITNGPTEIAIALVLENKLTNLQRASQRRYTSADQRVMYPTLQSTQQTSWPAMPTRL